MDDRARIDATLDELARVKADRDYWRNATHAAVGDIAILKGTTPYVEALARGLLPRPEQWAEDSPRSDRMSLDPGLSDCQAGPPTHLVCGRAHSFDTPCPEPGGSTP